MHKILVITFYFLLDAAHVSDCISPKHVERILKMKSNHKNFVQLVGLYTYFRMMHGAYNIEKTIMLP